MTLTPTDLDAIAPRNNDVTAITVVFRDESRITFATPVQFLRELHRDDFRSTRVAQVICQLQYRYASKSWSTQFATYEAAARFVTAYAVEELWQLRQTIMSQRAATAPTTEVLSAALILVAGATPAATAATVPAEPEPELETPEAAPADRAMDEAVRATASFDDGVVLDVARGLAQAALAAGAARVTFRLYHPYSPHHGFACVWIDPVRGLFRTETGRVRRTVADFAAFRASHQQSWSA